MACIRAILKEGQVPVEHRLIQAVEKALGWQGAQQLGQLFARGSIADPEPLERLLTPARLLDMAMRRSLSPPQFRCFQGGRELHPNDFISPHVTLRGQSIPMVDMARLRTLLRSGATMVMDQANVFDPTMEVLCRAMQWWSREHVQVNVYLTTGGAAGFGLHWDDHDVLIIQIAGEKEWEVRNSSRPAPMYRDAERNDTPSEEIVWAGTMKTGDIMHIPRGYWHQATRVGSGEGQSMHITLGFAKRTGVNWLSWLADWSRETELLRHDLDRWGTLETQDAQRRQLTDAACHLIASRDPVQYLDLREREATPPRHVPFLELLGPLEAVVCIAPFPPLIEDHGETVDVLACGKRLTFTAKAFPSLHLLLSGHHVRIREAVPKVGSEAANVAKILTEEELCAILTPDLSSGYTGLVTNAAF